MTSQRRFTYFLITLFVFDASFIDQVTTQCGYFSKPSGVNWVNNWDGTVNFNCGRGKLRFTQPVKIKTSAAKGENRITRKTTNNDLEDDIYFQQIELKAREFLDLFKHVLRVFGTIPFRTVVYRWQRKAAETNI